ncbi:hypothetical protein KQH98_06210 [Lactococcus lactis]|uniref:hypothetical protein n=1 Tax=Lactococcus lactis TaxID=1358 RepID=UPI001C0F4394|nr:hypothetical protein [Lactococcus lactis]MBU5242903.1 hypothetical protein [Lactococcus lactis]
MTDISGKSMEEIYREEARRYKESIEKERVYSESEDILTGNFDKSESLTVTMPMEEFDKLEKLALSAHTDKLSVEKLQEQLNTAKNELTEISEDVPKPPKYNLNAEFWRTQWSEASGAHLMEYLRAEKLKKDNEILKKALTEIAYGEYNTFKLSAVPIAKQVLAAIGGGGCPVGAVGKNGLTKEELEGSGDE